MEDIGGYYLCNGAQWTSMNDERKICARIVDVWNKERLMNKGVVQMPSLLEAIEDKYGSVENFCFYSATVENHQVECIVSDCEEDGMHFSIFIPKRSPRKIVPALLVLNEMDIETAGDGEEIQTKCSGVEELDLAWNKLNCWSEIIAILTHMPRLRFANLSFNRLTLPLDSSILMQTYPLRNLVLNSTQIDWRSVQRLLNLLPGLEELHLSLNNYEQVEIATATVPKKLPNKCLSCRKAAIGIINRSRFKAKDGNSNVKIMRVRASPMKSNESTNASSEAKKEIKTSEKRANKYISDSSIIKCVQCEKSFIRKTDEFRHAGLKRLDFSGNAVAKWREIVKIGRAFPNLISLNLAGCPVETLNVDETNANQHPVSPRKVEVKQPVLERRKIAHTPSSPKQIPRVQAKAAKVNSPLNSPKFLKVTCDNNQNNSVTAHADFVNLQCLNMDKTQLSTWNDIDRLSMFPSLYFLRIQGCPLWESHEDTQFERRQMFIARLPNVTVLNGGDVISFEERETAERAFIRYFMEKAESERPKRYFELESIHGRLQPLANVDFRPEKRVRIKFTFDDRSEMKEIAVYRTVADLKSRLEPMTGLTAAKMRLFYVDQDLRDFQGPEEMKYPSKQLYSYNIQSGDEIIIDSKKQRTTSSSSMS